MLFRTCMYGVALASTLAASAAGAASATRVDEPAASQAGPTDARPSRERVRRSRGIASRTPLAAASETESAPEGREGAGSSRRRAVQVLPPPRPADLGGASPQIAAASPDLEIRPSLASTSPTDTQPIASTNWFSSFFGLPSAQPRGTQLPRLAGRGEIDALIAHHAKLNGVPESLVHRIVIRESKYNPRAVGRGGAMGLMQIKTATARGVGYQGGPAGLLDAETNLTYGVKYLAGAYRTSNGDHDLAVSHYARGYYYAARRQGLVQSASAEPRRGRRGGRSIEPEVAAPAQAAPSTPSFFSFASRTASALPAEDRSAR